MNTDGHDPPLPHSSTALLNLRALDHWLRTRALHLSVRSTSTIYIASLSGPSHPLAAATGSSFSEAVSAVVAFWDRERGGEPATAWEVEA